MFSVFYLNEASEARQGEAKGREGSLWSRWGNSLASYPGLSIGTRVNRYALDRRISALREASRPVETPPPRASRSAP